MSERREPEAVVYPAAPLRAVAIEARFPVLLDAFSRFATFQRRHVADFDDVYETSEDDWEREGLPEGREFSRPRSAVLMGKGREHAVSVAKDRLAIITYPYLAGFSGFLSWAMPMLREGLDDLGVERIGGVNYRYENRIKQDTRQVDLGSILTLSLSAPPEARSAMRHVHLYWQQVWPEGTVEVELEGCPQVSQREIHLNITAHRATKSGSRDEIDGLVHDAHKLARLTFEGLITPGFRDQLRSTSK